MSQSDTPIDSPRALKHPLVLTSLALLVLNDHLLKGSGALPGWLTGKLSDFAGPVVAVALLAALTARTRFGVRAAAVATSLGFAAINLSHEAAGAMTWLTGLVGHPWSITVDPTDLVGLVVVPWAVVVIERHQEAQAPQARRWTPARLGLAMVAALACVASEPAFPPGSFISEVAILNNTPNPLQVLVRELDPTVELNCEAVAVAPEELLDRGAFAQGQTWSIPSREFIPLAQDPPVGRLCHAALIEASGMEPRLIFWTSPLDNISRTNPLPRRQNPDAQTVEIVRAAEGRFEARDAEDLVLVHPAPPQLREVARGECALPDPSRSPAWGLPIPAGQWVLGAVDKGIDGCFTLDLINDIDGAGDFRWHLCVPSEAFPFEAGQRVNILRRAGEIGAAAGNHEAVVVVAIDEEGEPGVEMIASRGQGLPVIHGLQIVANPIEGCVGEFDPCGTHRVAARLRVRAGAEAFDLESEQALPPIAESRGDIFLFSGRVTHRDVVNVSCSELAPELGPEIELVSLFIPDTQED